MRLNPCIENLNDMTPVDGGRYCGSCSKTIVDLTEKSNTEIFNLYKENNGNLCGIVLPNQLQENKYYHPLKRFALALIIVFGTSLFVFANASGFNNFQSKAMKQLAQNETKLVLKGYVHNEEGPLVGAVVSAEVDGKYFSAITEMDGRFNLNLPALGFTDQIVVTIEYAGHVTHSKIVDIPLGAESHFIGRVKMEYEKNELVKGKIAIKEDLKVIKTAGVVAKPVECTPIEIQSKGEIVAPQSPSIIESSGGIRIEEGIQFD